MNEWIYYDIPRIFTAAAQWGACMVYVLILKKRFGRIKTILLSLPFLILQCVLLLSTENLSPIWWTPVLAAALALMWIMLAALCRNGKKELGYAALCAFLSAETTTALEWLIHYYVVYICGVDMPAVKIALPILLFGIFFIIVWMAERKLLDRINGFRVMKKEIYVTLGIIIFVFLMSNLSYMFPDTPFSSRLFYEVFRIRAFIDIMGMFVLFIYQLQIREKLEMIEMNSISQVLRSQYEKYLYQQKSSELISIKYHDLKHQIAALRKESNQKKREEWLDSIENEIDSYKMGADTGNSVLNAVIEDKMLSIRKYNIEFTYVINGRLLEFMHVTDICSIFGNGLDNAIEAEILEQDEDKRIIHLTVAAKRKMVCITMGNYISHPEKISADHLETTKSNADYHGYGIKSIRYCVDKYHGNLTVGTNGNWFVLNIIIPQR
ncbi:MAG TPA: GHKL domain-containing protein [Candidatus Mediterraneibacter ornithocaccae]|nr:GHKL domain-containing protein [Candidatus Mediterraneibacter ornithocaccae]